MLALRPSCEHCDVDLPPESTDARICSFECTFCATCVEDVIYNVCPNCGGGFTPRPQRPKNSWKGGAYLGKRPASTARHHRPVDLAQHARFAEKIRGIPPEKR